MKIAFALFIRLDRYARAQYVAGWRCKALASLVLTAFLSGCDGEREKAWGKWRIESDKVGYRCGTYNGYELRIEKSYIFFGPTYEGRSDWVAQGPPPLSCKAELETLSIDAYWPGMRHAGYYAGETREDSDRIHIVLDSVPNVKEWDLVRNLEYRFGADWRSTLVYKVDKDSLGLNYIVAPSWPFPNETMEYYWFENSGGAISVFIICETLVRRRKLACEYAEYIPEMKVILKVGFTKSNLKYWKEIGRDVKEFILERTLRGAR